MMDPQLQQRAAKIRLLLMDVDGVITNGLIYNLPGANGDLFETKGFNSQDGIALQWLIWKGFQTGVITGRESEAVEVRAKQVGMTREPCRFGPLAVTGRCALRRKTTPAWP